MIRGWRSHSVPLSQNSAPLSDLNENGGSAAASRGETVLLRTGSAVAWRDVLDIMDASWHGRNRHALLNR